MGRFSQFFLFGDFVPCHGAGQTRRWHDDRYQWSQLCPLTHKQQRSVPISLLVDSGSMVPRAAWRTLIQGMERRLVQSPWLIRPIFRQPLMPPPMHTFRGARLFPPGEELFSNERLPSFKVVLTKPALPCYERPARPWLMPVGKSSGQSTRLPGTVSRLGGSKVTYFRVLQLVVSDTPFRSHWELLWLSLPGTFPPYWLPGNWVPCWLRETLSCSRPQSSAP